MNNTGRGTEVVANVTMMPQGSNTLATTEWYCEFWTAGRKLRVNKAEAFQEDENNYACYVDTTKVGRGPLFGQLTVQIPDIRASDGYRQEVSEPFPVMASENNDKQLYIV